MTNNKQAGFSVWFSYAGAQNDLVQSMYKQMEFDNVASCVDDALDAITNEPPNTVPGKYGNIRFVPFGYILKEKEIPLEDCDKRRRVYRLTGADSIALLLNDISASVFKIFVLSKAFFRSEACMKELCLSLCAKSLDNEKLPFLILDGFKDPESVITEQRFAFFNSTTKDGVIYKQTLEESLKKLHAELCSECANYHKGFYLTKDFTSQFKERLENWQRKVYQAGDDNVSTLVTEFYRYGFRYLQKTSLATDNSYLAEMYEKWEQLFKVRQLVTLMEKDPTLNFSGICSITSAEEFLIKVEGLLRTLSNTEVKAIAGELYQLYALAILKGMNCVGMSLRVFFGNKDLPLHIHVEDESHISFHSRHQACFTFCVVNGYIPKRLSEVANQSVEKLRPTGCAEIMEDFQPEKNECNDAFVLAAFQSVWGQLNKHEPNEISDLNEFINNTAKRRDLRSQLQRVNGEKFVFLLLTHNQYADDNGHFPLLERMEKILNQGFDEHISLPSVVLRNQRANNERNLAKAGINQMDMLMIEQGTPIFRNYLVNLRDIIKGE